MSWGAITQRRIPGMAARASSTSTSPRETRSTLGEPWRSTSEAGRSLVVFWELSPADEPEQQEQHADHPLVPGGGLAHVRNDHAPHEKHRSHDRNAPVQPRAAE